MDSINAAASPWSGKCLCINCAPTACIAAVQTSTQVAAIPCFRGSGKLMMQWDCDKPDPQGPISILILRLLTSTNPTVFIISASLSPSKRIRFSSLRSFCMNSAIYTSVPVLNRRARNLSCTDLWVYLPYSMRNLGAKSHYSKWQRGIQAQQVVPSRHAESRSGKFPSNNRAIELL